METNLCVAGFGGQGVMTLGKFLATATCESTDKNVTFFPSYGAEQRDQRNEHHASNPDKARASRRQEHGDQHLPRRP